MITNAAIKIKTFFSSAVPKQDQNEFMASVNTINIARAKITCLMFILLEIILSAVSFFTQNGAMLKPPGIYYSGLYLTMFLTMLAFYRAFDRLEENISVSSRKIQIVGTAFTGFILCWSAASSVLDDITSGQIMVYTFAVIAVAVTPIFEPLALLRIYLPIHIGFCVLLAAVPGTSTFPIPDIINSTTFLLVAWFISLMRYKTQVAEFRNAKLTEEKNLELNRVNAELQEANRKLEELSRIDGLTGIFNRAMFDFTVRAEWDRCKRQSLPLSLLMIDIDYFKNFNDHYGHQAGDDCIRRVVGVLTSCAKRASDAVARYGGEEFAVILPCTEKGNAEMLAEQIRESVEKLKIPHADSCISDVVTISLGVYSMVPNNSCTVKELIENADKALYHAKEIRNKVIVFSSPDL